MEQIKTKLIIRLKTISLYSMGQILGIFSILLLSFIIIKYHSTELWGEYVEIFIWTNFLLLFLAFGNLDFLLKSFSRFPKTINQQWTNSILARSVLLIPSYMLIYIIPVFNGLEILVFILLIIYFINQSFKVLILYHRNFKFNIWVELTGVLILVLYLYLIFERLDLKSLLFIIIIVQGFKLICYSIFYFQGFNNIKLQIDLKNLQQCFPFFIPLVFGTIRAKIDAYYGTYFFSVNDLSKYQIMLSFLTMAQMGGAFVINPFLKNFYRINNTVVKRLQKKFFIYGWFYAIIMSVLMYFIISKIYNLHFLKEQYLMAFAFIPPLFLHILLINEYYKKNRQNEIAKIASVVVVIQIILGYVLIKNWYISGALFLKLIGQWSIVIILWLWIKDYKKE